jgi:urate oxidase
MVIDGEPHAHSFYRDGEEKRIVEATITRGVGIDIKSGIVGLSVLKSTGSAFHGFVRDEYTTLPEVWDRILSTDIDCSWTWKRFTDRAAVENGVERFNKAWEQARTVLMRTFANDYSASVQNTMYKMAEEILQLVPEVDKVGLSLPNKHYWEVGKLSPLSSNSHSGLVLTGLCDTDLSWHKGLKNTGKDAEVFAPQTNPNGLIKCEVARDQTTVTVR